MGQKPCQFTKEDTQIADKYEKMLHIICHQGNAKQQETTTRLLGTAKIWNTDNTKYWQGYETTGILIRCWLECKLVQPLWKTVWQFLIKLNILLPYKSSNGAP